MRDDAPAAMQQNNRPLKLHLKRLGPALAILLLGIIGVITNPLAGLASSYNTEIATTGAVIYGSLRFASSAMSVAKDADLGGSVAVASVTFSPGQVLEPVTATINRMADLLFGLVLASGIVSVTLPALARIGAVLMAVAGVLLFVAQFAHARMPADSGLQRLGSATARFGVVVAIIVPAAYATAFMLGDLMTADAWRSATAVFDKLSEDFEAPPEPILPVPEVTTPPVAAPETETGLLEGLVNGVGTVIGQTKDAVVGAAQATAGFAAGLPDQVSRNAKIVGDGIAVSGQLFNSSVQLGAAYLVKLVVLPLFLLFTGLWLLRQLNLARRGAQIDSVPSVPTITGN